MQAQEQASTVKENVDEGAEAVKEGVDSAAEQISETVTDAERVLDEGAGRYAAASSMLASQCVVALLCDSNVLLNVWCCLS